MTSIKDDGTPRYVRVYDNGGETCDRYTVVFTGRRGLGGRMYLGMSEKPYHPQGFCQHGESNTPLDRPRYAFLGKRIKFSDLPQDCQCVALDTYKELWNA